MANPISWLGLLEGGLLGIGKSLADLGAQEGERKRAAATARWSPWTNMKPENVRQVTPFQNIAGSALLGSSKAPGEKGFLEGIYSSVVGDEDDASAARKVAGYRGVAGVEDLPSAAFGRPSYGGYPSLGVNIDPLSPADRSPQSLPTAPIYGRRPSRPSWLGVDFSMPSVSRRRID
jgi:hypothetical protein